MEAFDLASVNWARAQFALTAMYHWMFVPLTLGLSFLMAFFETIYVKTGNEEWKHLTKFWMTLFGMSMLSMAVMGYQAGLTGTRSTFATWTLAATFAFVIILITDLDRPRMSLFQMNQNLMVELHNRMDGGEPRDGSAATR